MTNQPKRIRVEIEDHVARRARRFWGALYQILSSATPVETGFARASLTPAVGKPSLQLLPRPSDKNQAKKIADSLVTQNKARIVGIANTYKLKQGGLFFTYRAGYVRYLNMGSSAQAPKNFIERSIQTAKRAF